MRTAARHWRINCGELHFRPSNCNLVACIMQVPPPRWRGWRWFLSSPLKHGLTSEEDVLEACLPTKSYKTASGNASSFFLWQWNLHRTSGLGWFVMWRSYNDDDGEKCPVFRIRVPSPGNVKAILALGEKGA